MILAQKRQARRPSGNTGEITQENKKGEGRNDPLQLHLAPSCFDVQLGFTMGE